MFIGKLEQINSIISPLFLHIYHNVVFTKGKHLKKYISLKWFGCQIRIKASNLMWTLLNKLWSIF